MFSLHITPGFARHLRRGATVVLVAVLILGILMPQSASAEQTGTVTASELFIRKSPSTDAEKLRTLEEGWQVSILSTDGDWYKVRYGEVEGYSSKKYISTSGSSGKSSSSDSSKTIASLGSAPSACKPGDKNDSVLKIQKALSILGYYDGNQTGNYGDLTEQAVKDFQKAKGLSVDGIAGKGTIKAIFGTNASSSSSSSSKKLETEKLDWFNGGDSVIPKNAKFEVKDVRSGRTFTARRWSGANHLDAEPLSKDDAAVIKKNYGGSFGWSRRPILVKYNGHVYAASMTSMPHGTQTISGNDFEGHFCIHFYKSRTHETDRVDEEHQAAVSEAMKASW